MKKVLVPVLFEGTVEVLVPDYLSDLMARSIGVHLALAKVVATIENPDAPEDQACHDYSFVRDGNTDEEAAELEWDTSIVSGISGKWDLLPEDSCPGPLDPTSASIIVSQDGQK